MQNTTVATTSDATVNWASGVENSSHPANDEERRASVRQASHPTLSRAFERFVRRCATVAAVTGSLGATALPTGTPASLASPAGPAACPRPFVEVPTPHGGTSVTFSAVSARRSTDAWAVGSRFTGSRDVTLAERWDGTTWRSVTTPNPPGDGSHLTDVITVAADNAWAVGYTTTASGQTVLIERWDGSSWRLVRAPDVGSSIASLASVAATGPADAWAVGSALSDTGFDRTLVLRWDGSAWRQVPSPNASAFANALDAVSARSPTDAWAVGSSVADVAGSTRTLALRWDGTAWSLSPSVDPSPVANALTGVAVGGETDVWTVGTYNGGTDNLTLTERWDGSSWTQVFAENLGASGNVFNDVAAVSPSDVWAVGYWYQTAPRGPFEVLAERWDGASWRIVPTPGQAHPTDGDLAEYLVGTAVAGGRVWAGGSATSAALLLTSCDPSG